MADRKPTPLVAGNWKMNGLAASVAELRALIDGLPPGAGERYEAMICPPATLLRSFAEAASGSAVRLGGQDCHPKPSGAHTGDISAEMLKDAGASAVIVGHSGRRTDYAESDALVRAKAEGALRAGLIPIVCVGETEAERLEGRTTEVVARQLDGSLPPAGERLVVAYEPVWAIGTGRTPTPDDVAEVHALVRRTLVARYGAPGAGVRILYGGSVKPDNAAPLMSVENVDGALVGGAGLKAADFLGIIRVYA